VPHALIVYESMFGNGHRVADLVAEGLREAGWRARTERVLDAPESPECDLLVLGGPTHAMGLSRAATRATRSSYVVTEEDARRVACEPGADTGRGLREYLSALRIVPGQPVAVYDTRGARGPAGAAGSALRRLAGREARIVTGAEHFIVRGFTGPLRPGEEERARAWGVRLASLVAAAVGV